MTKQKNTKKALLTSVLSMMLCMAMLIGSTFAWFTDSVTSGKNIIKAGNLDISATVHELAAWDGGSYENKEIWNYPVSYTLTQDFINKGTGDNVFAFPDEGENLNGNADFMSDSLFEPGKTFVKMIRVKNDGSLAAKIKLHFNVEDGGLQDALWFALATTDGEQEIQLNRQPMSGLNEALNALSDLVLMPKGTTGSKFGDTIDIIFAYGMNEEAGNEYQKRSFEATMSILATQYTYEHDSFDDQYDKNAGYPVINAAALKEQLAGGGIVTVENSIEMSNENTYEGRYTVTKDTVLNLHDSTLTFKNSATDESMLNIAALYIQDGSFNLTAEEGGIDSDFYGFYVGFADTEYRPTLTIDGGTYKAGSIVNVASGTVYIRGGLFDGRDVYGDGETATYLLNCIDRTYKNGTANIIVTGGTFINFDPSNNTAEGAGTNFVPEGYSVISEVIDGNTYYTVALATR